MKRGRWAIPVLLFLGSPWLAQGGYSYYHSQALWPTNWNNWNFNGSIPVNCYNSYCGATNGYGGAGTALYAGSSYGARGEVRLTIGRGSNLPSYENYYAYFSANEDPTLSTSTFFAFELSCSSGAVYFYERNGNYVTTLLASAPATCTDPVSFRAVLNNTQGNTETAIAYVGNTRVLKYSGRRNRVSRTPSSQVWASTPRAGRRHPGSRMWI